VASGLLSSTSYSVRPLGRTLSFFARDDLPLYLFDVTFNAEDDDIQRLGAVVE